RLPRPRSSWPRTPSGKRRAGKARCPGRGAGFCGETFVPPFSKLESGFLRRFTLERFFELLVVAEILELGLVADLLDSASGLDGAADPVYGLSGVAGKARDDRGVVEDPGIPWGQVECPGDLLAGALRVPGAAQADGQARPGRSSAWIDLKVRSREADRPRVGVLRRPLLLAPVVGVGEVGPALVPLRRQLDGLFEIARGVGVTAEEELGRAGVGVRAARRLDRDRLAVGRERVLVPVHLVIGGPEVAERPGVVGGELRDAAEHLDGPRVVSPVEVEP